jgi:pimeloyl-ACP methyl ester carboxylesterase
MLNNNYKMIDANGLRFAYLEAGQGPFVLCLHGFPDTPHTFDLLLGTLAKGGYHAVAPFTRGIYPTAVPADHDYSPLQLGRDALALIAAFGQTNATIVGHDWGAMSAYAAANLEPARVSEMVTIAIPHPRAIRMDLGLMRRGWHFAFLAIPWVAEFFVRVGNFALLRHFYRVWSPSMSLDQKLISKVTDSYSEPESLKAALGYYRSFALAFLGVGRKQRREREILFRKTSVPTLCLVGAEDGVFDETVFDRTPEAFTGRYELIKIREAGHFLHLERSADFLEKVLAFLGCLRSLRKEQF